MTRDVLDKNGVKIGELTLPDSTPEEFWQSILSAYSTVPSPPDRVLFNIQERKQFCAALMERFKKKNLADGINADQAFWMYHKMREYGVTFHGADRVVNLFDIASNGDIEIACLALIYGDTDDMTEGYHWLGTVRKAWLITELKSFLGWP